MTHGFCVFDMLEMQGKPDLGLETSMVLLPTIFAGACYRPGGMRPEAWQRDPPEPDLVYFSSGDWYAERWGHEVSPPTRIALDVEHALWRFDYLSPRPEENKRQAMLWRESMLRAIQQGVPNGVQVTDYHSTVGPDMPPSLKDGTASYAELREHLSYTAGRINTLTKWHLINAYWRREDWETIDLWKNRTAFVIQCARREIGHKPLVVLMSPCVHSLASLGYVPADVWMAQLEWLRWNPEVDGVALWWPGERSMYGAPEISDPDKYGKTWDEVARTKTGQATLDWIERYKMGTRQLSAIDFNGSSSLSLSGAGLNLPDSDWAISLWLKLDDNAGVSVNNILCHQNGSTANPNLRLFSYESLWSNASQKGRFQAYANDDDTTDSYILEGVTTQKANETGWHNIILCRVGNTGYLYWDAVSLGTDDWTSVDALTLVTNLTLGRRVGGADYLDGAMAQLACYKGTLTSDHIAQLSGTGAYAGAPRTPEQVFELANLAWLLRGNSVAAEATGNLTVANSGVTVIEAGPTFYEPDASDPRDIDQWQSHRRETGQAMVPRNF